METHIVIEIFSTLWWRALLYTLGLIFIILYVAPKISDVSKDILTKVIGSVLIFIAIAIHPYLVFIGKWNIQTSLPLHICTASGIIAGISLFWRNQTLYEILVYFGIPAGLQSILTPELIHGKDSILLVEYYLLHGGMILSALYQTKALDMKPRKHSWIKIFLYGQMFVAFVGLINFMIGSNYIFLCRKPLVENPLIIGDWPYYIIVLELVALIHFYVIYSIFKFNRLVSV